MDKSAFMGGLIGSFAFYMLAAFLEAIKNRFIWEESDEETFWESHPFENSLEEADNLCEIGYTFQRNEIIYKKISGKEWFAEILIPDDDQFEIGCELTIENYIYKKIGEKAWTIESLNWIFLHIDILKEIS